MSPRLDDQSFALLVSLGVLMLQGHHWHPDLGSDLFFRYCDSISSTQSLYPTLEVLRPALEELIQVGGYEVEMPLLTQYMLNFIRFYLCSWWKHCDVEETLPLWQEDKTVSTLPEDLVREVRL